MAERRVFSVLPWLTCAAIAGAVGCYAPDDGRAPPLDRFYFPVGLALGPDRTDGGVGPSRLYVVNSDFDLQFNAGSVQVYDLDRIRALIPRYCDTDAQCDGGQVCDVAGNTVSRAFTHTCVDPADPQPCGELGVQNESDRVDTPGLCNFVDPGSPPGGGGSLLIQSVSIGAFATDALYRVNPLGNGRQGRLFIPVRGDSTLHWIDVDEDGNSKGSLDCGQGRGIACDGNHRRGQDSAAENSRELVLQPEPYGVAADPDGTAILTTHQTRGAVSLFVNRWEPADGAPVGPRLEYVASGLPTGALGIAAVPVSGFVRESPPGTLLHQPSFLVTFRNSAEVRLVSYFADNEFIDGGGTVQSIDPSRPFLDDSRSTPIQTQSLGYDSRGVAVDDGERVACESRCGDGDGRLDCLHTCATTPLRSYIANRSPAALILGSTQPNYSAAGSDDLPTFDKSTPIGVGASRVYVGKVRARSGELETRIFTVCYDSRQIYIYDPVRKQQEPPISTGFGPHALAIDSANALGYLGHFRDSYIGVIDLNQAHGATYGKMVLTLGEAQAPRAAK